ncbi:MAG: Hint domain-containing protein, partial [Pseudomonadota bacterium]
TGVVSLTTTEPALICFTSGTRILTPGGWVPVERIGIGDLVVTKDKGARAVRWIGKRRVGADRLARQPQLRPIRIERDRMGPGQPRRDLQLSPQHRVLVSGWEADLLFGQAEVLVAAKALGTTVAVAEVTYIHLLFDGHEIVWAEGLACESLHPGDTAMRGLDAASRGEILAIFPELGDEAGRQSRRLARPELKPREFHAVGHLRRAMRSE